MSDPEVPVSRDRCMCVLLSGGCIHGGSEN
jgi:hypothetical protein